jgi:hypothetical protein
MKLEVKIRENAGIIGNKASTFTVLLTTINAPYHTMLDRFTESMGEYKTKKGADKKVLYLKNKFKI